MSPSARAMRGQRAPSPWQAGKRMEVRRRSPRRGSRYGHDACVAVEMTFLSQDDVVAAGGTDMAAVIDVIEGAFRLKAAGEVINPQKVMLTWSDEPATQERH